MFFFSSSGGMGVCTAGVFTAFLASAEKEPAAKSKSV